MKIIDAFPMYHGVYYHLGKTENHFDKKIGIIIILEEQLGLKDITVLNDGLIGIMTKNEISLWTKIKEAKLCVDFDSFFLEGLDVEDVPVGSEVVWISKSDSEENILK